jgi:hypothetical protein
MPPPPPPLPLAILDRPWSKSIGERRLLRYVTRSLRRRTTGSSAISILFPRTGFFFFLYSSGVSFLSFFFLTFVSPRVHESINHDVIVTTTITTAATDYSATTFSPFSVSFFAFRCQRCHCYRSFCKR